MSRNDLPAPLRGHTQDDGKPQARLGGAPPDDSTIVEMFWNRSRGAVTALAGKYGGYCRTIADNILGSPEDSEECVNDAYMRVWNAIPPERPRSLTAFLAKITRNLALDRVKHSTRKKRGGTGYDAALSELEEFFPSAERTDKQVEDKVVAEALNGFIGGLDRESRAAFVLRYFHLYGIAEVAEKLGVSENRVKYLLRKTREELKDFLEKEDLL